MMQRFQPILLALTLLSWLMVPSASSAQQVARGAADGEPLHVVVFGDSLIAGYGVGPGEAFPEQLQVALRDRGYGVEVTNAGASGDTSSGGLARLDWSVPTEADLVIVELGANDALRGISPEITEKNLDQILQTLTERGQAVILAGMIAPPNMGPDYSAAFNPIYAGLAEKYDVALYPFFLDGVATQPKLNQDDAMHPNKEGVAVIVEKMLPLVTETLDSVNAGRVAGRNSPPDAAGAR
ncbi:arylesterase [Aurantimonas sp. A3-2-R12]|uniref:arylesterase n=1 Tax=Aurantimonas sp. A3-2-R12 TaxID=3114362 RepID=UPI003FA4A2AF